MSLFVLIAAGVLAYQTSVTGQAEPSNVAGDSYAAPAAQSVRPDVIYQVFFKENGEIIGSPTVTGQFGREVQVVIPNRMRVVVIAEASDQEGLSRTSAKMSIFEDDAWRTVKQMSMEAMLSMSPSFEYSVEGTPYRFVIMPRLIVPAAD
jgi:hypothetical protein